MSALENQCYDGDWDKTNKECNDEECTSPSTKELLCTVKNIAKVEKHEDSAENYKAHIPPIHLVGREAEVFKEALV